MKQLLSCYLIIYSAFVFLPARLVGADWQRAITNYPRHSYRAAAQNWMVTQDKNGWMYFANNKGLLEFDGVYWEVYPIHNAKMRAVKIGDNGYVYVGGLQQFGYFFPDSLGRLEYVCLSDSIEAGDIGNIWNIHIAGGSVYFQSDNAVFCLEKGRLRRIGYDNIICSNLVDGRLYVAGDALSVLNGNDFFRFPETSSRLNVLSNRIIGIFPYKEKVLLVSNQGELLVYGEGYLTPLRFPAENVLRKHRLFCAALQDSLLALGTVQDGLLLLDLETGEMEHISVHNGLQNKTILSLCFDRDDNLWLGLDNGIDCIHLASPLLRNSLPIGSGYASCLYRNKLYLGTNQGMFVTDYPLMLSKEQRIIPLPDMVGQIYSLSVCDDKLFCAGSNQLGIIDGEDFYSLAIRGVWWVKPLSRKDRLLAATYTGYCILKKEGTRWQVERRIGNEYSSKSLYVEPGTDVLWTANKEDGIYRLRLSEALDSVVKAKCYNSAELPAGDNVCITTVDREVIIASRQGLFRYNHLADSLERAVALEKQLDGRKAYTCLLQDSLHNIWYVSGGALKLLRYDSLARTYYHHENEVYLKDCLIEDFEHINLLSRSEAIIGMEEGFSVLDLLQQPVKKHPLHLQIRYVYSRGVRDTLVYGSSHAGTERRLRLPYTHNSIRIAYSANNYDKSFTLLYSCRLEGPVSEPWSPWDEGTTKEYTTLPEGKYTFYVRTNAQEGTETVTSFPFEVLPPWYRTWWSYLLYFISGLLMLLFVGYRIRAARRRLVMKQELELYRQQQEFKRESDLKDRKIDSLKEENLQAELRHKSEELIRSTLNIVRKNEMLQDIKKEVLGISHSVSEENLVSIRRKTLRLLGKIETNIEHDDDLQAFQSTFDSVHYDFFKKLEKAYPELNNKEKLLCAYIKMNLLSKEIAPLLNISLRGVEISRYRLRKKLSLEEGENLAEFLQKFANG